MICSLASITNLDFFISNFLLNFNSIPNRKDAMIKLFLLLLQAFLNDFEGPPNVAVTVPSDTAQVPITNIAGRDEEHSDETDSAVRMHNRAGGFKFIFLVILVVTALTSGFCFFRAVRFDL